MRWMNNSHGNLIQIRAVPHPEDGISDIGDKCHQLFAAIQHLNDQSKNMIIFVANIPFMKEGFPVSLYMTCTSEQRVKTK